MPSEDKQWLSKQYSLPNPASWNTLYFLNKTEWGKLIRLRDLSEMQCDVTPQEKLREQWQTSAIPRFLGFTLCLLSLSIDLCAKQERLTFTEVSGTYFYFKKSNNPMPSGIGECLPVQNLWQLFRHRKSGIFVWGRLKFQTNSIGNRFVGNGGEPFLKIQNKPHVPNLSRWFHVHSSFEMISVKMWSECTSTRSHLPAHRFEPFSQK